jgi:hypothetical protein
VRAHGPAARLRIAFGLVWAIDAALKWLPGFKDSYQSTIQGIAAGHGRRVRPAGARLGR